MLPARLLAVAGFAAAAFVVSGGSRPPLAGAAQPPADPVYEGKKASEWVNVLQNDASARKRTQAVAALAAVWADHQYKDALPNIGRSLRVDTSPAVRRQAAASIAGLKPETVRAIENEVVEGLKAEKHPAVRKELAVALGRFPEVAKKAVGPLASVLADADPAARAAAADALAKAGSDAKGAAPALLDRLADPDKAVRQAVLFALGRVGPENPSFVAAALLKRYSEEKESELRREAVVSLGLVGDRSEATVVGLAAALGDADADTRAAAVAALASFGTAAKGAADALLKLATAKSPEAAAGLRVDAVRAFGSVLGADLKGRVAVLVGVMENDPDFEVRVAAVEEVGALGAAVKDDVPTMTALRKRLSDPQVKVRAAAAEAIRRTEKKPPKPADKKP